MQPKRRRSYPETVEYLFARLPMYQRTGAGAGKWDLSKTYALLHALGDPHRALRVLHVAGTNGKGTVSHTLSALCTAAGLRTGLYTSPHYVDYRERIRVDGAMVSEGFVIDFVAEHEGLLERTGASFFEFTVAMALTYFVHRGVDVAVLEVGMGGRLDSTNVVDPLVAVITNIGLDHTEVLGDTLTAIAGEKAGIIKPGRPVVVGLRQNETAPVFAAVAAERGAPLHYAEELVAETSLSAEVDLAGPFARENLRTALAAFSLAAPSLGIAATPAPGALRDIGGQSGYRGRFTRLGEFPTVLVDAGHNAPAWRRLVPAVLAVPHAGLHVVCGFVQGKDPREFAERWPSKTRFYLGDIDLPRNRPALETLEEWTALGLAAEAFGSIAEAYEAARGHAAASDLIFVGGSSFVVGALLGYLEVLAVGHA